MVVVDERKSLKDRIEENRQFAENIYKTGAEHVAKDIISQITRSHLTRGWAKYHVGVKNRLRDLNLGFDEQELIRHIVKYFRETEGVDVTLTKSGCVDTFEWSV